jgi:hypothetical protein
MPKISANNALIEASRCLNEPAMASPRSSSAAFYPLSHGEWQMCGRTQNGFARFDGQMLRAFNETS